MYKREWKMRSFKFLILMAGGLTFFIDAAKNEKTEAKVIAPEKRVVRNTDIKMSKLKNLKNIVPSLIIGTGPAGLSAALYSSRLGIKTYVLEGNSPGGLLMKTTDVENWPSKLHIQGPDLIKDLRTQAEHAGAQFIFDAASSIDLSQWPFRVKTEND